MRVFVPSERERETERPGEKERDHDRMIRTFRIVYENQKGTNPVDFFSTPDVTVVTRKQRHHGCLDFGPNKNICGILLLRVLKDDFAMSSSIKYLSQNNYRGQCYKTFLSVIYEFL
jgi:hypothetical protein